MSLIFPIAIVGSVVGAMSLYYRSQAKPWLEQAAADSSVDDANLTAFGNVSATVKGMFFRCEAKTTLPGKNTPGTWQTKVIGITLSRRTTFLLSFEGRLTKMADWLGFDDIEIGDETFDGAVRVKASDEGVIRGLLLKKDVQDAVLDALGAGESYGALRLDADGTLSYTTRRNGYDYDVFKRRADTMLTLARLLQENSHVTPVGQPQKQLPQKRGAGGASGAPVGVRTL